MSLWLLRIQTGGNLQLLACRLKEPEVLKNESQLVPDFVVVRLDQRRLLERFAGFAEFVQITVSVAE